MNMAEVVANVKYRPGWRLRVVQGRMGWEIQLSAEVMDAYNQHTTTSLRSVEVLPPYFMDGRGEDAPEDQMLRFVFAFLRRAEMHEVGEFFQYKGARPFDPHKGGL